MLSFLSYFLKYDGEPRRELQHFVCMEITSPVRKELCQLFTGDLGIKDLHLYVLEMKHAYAEFINDERYVQEIQIPPELSYTIEYIKLLGYCGEGKNAGTETRAQEKFSLGDIIVNMNLADFCFPLKSALVYFMDSIYFDIEKDVSDENVQKMHEFLHIVEQDLNRFIEIQTRTKQSQGEKKGGMKKRQPTAFNDNNEEPFQDLDVMVVDINKNFSMLTSFGSFTILYLIERYIFEYVYPALMHFFDLKLPIKRHHEDFFRNLFQLIQKATSFVIKDHHKMRANELFKTIKGVAQLKAYGCDCLNNKTLTDLSSNKKNNKKGVLGSIPQMSQAQKLGGYLKSVKNYGKLQDEFELEFAGLVDYVTQIGEESAKAFGGMNNIARE